MNKNTKKSSSKTTKQHKYRVSIYLGKDLYDTLSAMANFMGLPLATATRIMLQTGVQIGNALDERAMKELRKYGKS